MKRLVLLISLSFAYFCHVSSQVRTHYFTDRSLAGAFFDDISNNGKYVIGEHPGAYTGLLFIVETEQLITITSDVDGGLISTGDVSDEGIIVGSFTDPSALSENMTPCDVPAIYNYKEDTWTALDRPEGVIVVGGGFSGNATTISSDGKLIGGYLPTANKKYVYSGMIWNGDGSVSSILPDPQKAAGAKINSISDDGKVACGWREDALYGKVAIWKDGELLPIDKPGHGTAVSPNGKYVGGNFLDGVHRMGVPFIWTEETGIVAVNHPEDIFAGEVSGISDNGRIAIGHIDFNSMVDHHPFIIVDGVYHDFDEYMLTNYGIKGPEDASFFTVSSMSADGKVLSGFSLVNDARVPWILVFDEPMGVKNELENLSVSVYPNPVSDILNIEGDYTSATIYDNLGVAVVSDNVSCGKINVSNLSEGIYFVKVMKEKSSRTYKITINH